MTSLLRVTVDVKFPPVTLVSDGIVAPIVFVLTVSPIFIAPTLPVITTLFPAATRPL